MNSKVSRTTLTATQVDLLHISVILSALIANLAARPESWAIILGLPSFAVLSILSFQTMSILARKESVSIMKVGRRKVRVFEVSIGQISVSSFFGWPAIVVPKWAKELPDTDIQLQHEARHIERSDSIFFNFIFPTSISLTVVSVYLIGTGIPRSYADVAFFGVFREIAGTGTFPITSTLSLIIMILSIINLAVLSFSARDREFMCDSDMHQRLGASYQAFIGRGTRRESNERNGIVASTISAFTHPSFANREKNLVKSKALLHRTSFLLGCLFQINFWMYMILFIFCIITLIPFLDTIEFRILASKLGLNRALIENSFYLIIAAGYLTTLPFLVFCSRVCQVAVRDKQRWFQFVVGLLFPFGFVLILAKALNNETQFTATTLQYLGASLLPTVIFPAIFWGGLMYPFPNFRGNIVVHLFTATIFAVLFFRTPNTFNQLMPG